MMPYINILDMRYCTEYQYLSDKATDFHFKISFGAWLVYKYKTKPNFFKMVFGNVPPTLILQEKKVSYTFGLKQVRWYNLDLHKRASIENEVQLNLIKQQIIDKKLLKQTALIRKKGIVQKGKGAQFPTKKVEILIENHP